MNSLIALTLLGLMALVHGGDYVNTDYGHGYPGAVNHYPDNHRNGHRQLKVNNIAEHVGAGTGTADYVGVPGTGVGDHHGYAHGHGHGYRGHYNNYY